MCGIAGILDFRGRAVEADRLREMAATMRHRGPDDEGVHVSGPVGLAHTRLSIIDVSAAGHQPMLSEDGRWAIVFNGEIYNYRQLRTELEGTGCRFRSNCDTEVLLQAFATWGPACLDRLAGMFGFAIVDFAERRLFLARDRFGVKPVHYACVDGAFYFASEVKTLLRALPVRPRLNPLKLVELLVYRELIRDNLFLDVKTLEPGSYIDLAWGGEARPVVWYRVEEQPSADLSRELRGAPLEARVNGLEQALVRSVERRLVSDVPVGTLCSGGLDSSLLTAIVHCIDPKVAVFHVDVEGSSERAWARRVADLLRIELHEVRIDARSFVEQYVDCVYFNDFPLTHPNGIGIYYVSDLARRNGCKVLLTGEGADESFGGYDWRYGNRLKFLRLQRLVRLPSKLYSRATYSYSGVWLRRFNPSFNAKSRAAIDDVVDFCSDDGYRARLLERCRSAYGFVRDPIERDVQASMLSDLRDYISGILHRQDRASMQASIESRVPFLDHELVRYVVNLPITDRVLPNEGKAILKKLALRHLPRDLVYREKVGFGMPGDDYLRAIDREMFRDGFLAEEMGLDAASIHSALDREPGTYAQMLCGLEVWGRLFVYGQSRDEIKGRYLRL